MQKLEDWLVKIYIERRWVLRAQSESQNEASRQTQSAAKSKLRWAKMSDTETLKENYRRSSMQIGY